jgi:hypothetical protein
MIVRMHLFLGGVLLLAGLSCLRYVWAGAATFARETPLLALGVLLVALGLGLGLRARTARLLVQAGLGIGLAAVVVAAARLALSGQGSDHPDERLAVRFSLLGLALAAAGSVGCLLLLRRVRTAPAVGRVDLVPLGGLVVALGLGVVWLVADDARLRPCRNGSNDACGALARALLESAERTPAMPPSPAEERAARVLAAHRCRSDDRVQCGLQRYAVGTVEARAGRIAAAREAFLWACEAQSSWCARAAQEAVDWPEADQQRLARAGRARP